MRRLDRFSEADVAELLDDATLAPRVLALTRGEPLLARFACEGVNEGGVQALAEFERDPPEGVREYFDDQLVQLLEQGDLEGKGHFEKEFLALRPGKEPVKK